MLYHVTHTTGYSYETPVSYCIIEVLLTPRALEFQKLLACNIVVEPAAAFIRRSTDYFGNDVTRFAVFEKHGQFAATAASTVEVTSAPPYPATAITWEEARDGMAEHRDAET